MQIPGAITSRRRRADRDHHGQRQDCGRTSHERRDRPLLRRSRKPRKLPSWRGWAQSRWWNAPLLFWDDFSDDGQLGAESDSAQRRRHRCAPSARSRPENRPNSLSCWPGDFPIVRPIGAAGTRPRATSTRSSAIITRSASRAPGTPRNMPSRTWRVWKRKRASSPPRFAKARCPASIKEAASANLSTLVSTTCFRTADGEFHGFEGSNDKRGCCHGNCTHVWNYETSTALLFPRSRIPCAKRRSAIPWTMPAQCTSGSRCPTARTVRFRRGRRTNGPDHARISRLGPVG